MTRKEQEQFKHVNGLCYTKQQSKEKEKLKDELSCIKMIDSIICYNSNDLDYILNDHYMEKYIQKLGLKRVMELIQGQIDEKPFIIRGVYTDCEGLTYNTLVFKDEEGYYE